MHVLHASAVSISVQQQLICAFILAGEEDVVVVPNRPKRVEKARIAQVQPGEEGCDYELGSATASAASTSFQGNSAGALVSGRQLSRCLEALPDTV